MEQVQYTHAHAFWDAVMGYGYRQNNLRALVIDLLQGAPKTLLSIRLSYVKPIVCQDRLRDRCQIELRNGAVFVYREQIGSSTFTIVRTTPTATRPGWTGTSAPLAASATAARASTHSRQHICHPNAAMCPCISIAKVAPKSPSNLPLHLD